jgi:mannose-6-phosphate isomerase-like protein (cupin superfamily)
MTTETVQQQPILQSPIEECEWGTKTLVYGDDSMEIVKIEVAADWHSSIHLHRHKSNEFAVVSGEMRIFHQNANGNWRCEILRPGMPSVFVGKYTKHCFWATAATVAWEFYRPVDGQKIDAGDIVRFSRRGRGRPNLENSSILPLTN